MPGILRVIAMISLVLLLGLSLVDLRAAVVSSGAKEEWNEVASTIRRQDSRTGEPMTLWSPKASLASQRLQDSATVWRAPQEIHQLTSRALRLEAEQEVNVDRRIDLFCRSLAEIGSALEHSPHDADLLVSWASTRQLLGKTPCPSGPTEGDFRKVVLLALREAPHDSSAIFSGALVSLWGGDRASALALFERLLSSGYTLTSGQQGILLREIKSAGDFTAVVPERFPQIVHWSNVLRERRPGDFQAWSKEISQAQIDSLHEAVSQFKSGEIPPLLHEQRLLSLIHAAASDRVRAEIDRALTAFLEVSGKSDLARFYAKRSELSRRTVVEAVLGGDTRPKTSPLVLWGSRTELAFDDFFQTVGFFISKRDQVRLIELKGENMIGDIDPSMVTLFGSNDNQHWEDVGVADIKALSIEGRTGLAITLNRSEYLYWKIHFASSVHLRTFRGEVGQMLRVYGQ